MLLNGQRCYLLGPVGNENGGSKYPGQQTDVLFILYFFLAVFWSGQRQQDTALSYNVITAVPPVLVQQQHS